jgi:hypothetical protein
MFETITEILSELPIDQVKSAFMHWKEKCQWLTDHNGELQRGERHRKFLLWAYPPTGSRNGIVQTAMK